MLQTVLKILKTSYLASLYKNLIDPAVNIFRFSILFMIKFSYIKLLADFDI